MAKRDRTLTQRVIEKRMKEGRGQGNAAEYQPWLRIQDVAAKGLATASKVGRRVENTI